MVRAARPSDLDAILHFNESMARETEDVALDPSVLREGVRAVLHDPAKGRYFVAERDGQVVGGLLITYEWSDWRNGMFWWIQSVYVLPAHRRRGVFASLYRHVEALALADGACGLRLYVHEHNERARAIYERLGMVDSRYRLLETPDRLKG